MRNTDNSQDVLDVRDLIARYEELIAERDALTDTIDEIAARDNDESAALDEAKSALRTWDASDEAEECKRLGLFLEELKGSGGDEQWRGDWYPVVLIRDDHFEDYAEELAEEIGAISEGAKWPATCIDWEKAARELQSDYTSAEYDGVTYWFR